jgi:hypothetical protein
MTRNSLSAVVVASILLTSSLALAQDPTPKAATPPAAATPGNVASPAAAGATPQPAEAPAKADEEATRFRWGISGYGGPLAGGLSGGAGGIDARFGAQITKMFGIYGQPVLLVGAGANASVNGASASAIGLYGVGALGEVSLADLFYIAVGPEVLLGGMASSSVTTTGAAAAASTGPYLSVTARAGLALGSMKPQRRKAFTIGLDLRTIFNPGDPVVVPCLALGYDAF